MNLKNIWERPKPTGRDESKNNKVTKFYQLSCKKKL